MHRWFLSYNSQDLPLMRGLEAALRRKDPGAHIFFAPRSLRAGGYWLPELAKEIAQATAFVLLVGERGLGPWQAIEYYEALDRRVKERDFPMLLVLLDGQRAPGLPFLRQLHWIITADAASEESLARLMEGAAGRGSLPGELWRHAAPYRGLAAMTQADSDFFFGRSREIVDVIDVLAKTPDKLPILLGNSGVGKSSLAQAGVLASLARQGWPEQVASAGPPPFPFRESRFWCFLSARPGIEPLRALVDAFLRTWQLDPKDTMRARLLSSWVGDLGDGKVSLRELLDATELRHEDELRRPRPPAFFLYVDQGEELYARAEERQRRRFSEILAAGLADQRLRVVVSMRSDFLGALQADRALFDAHRQINVRPLWEAELREVVSRPAALLAARFESEGLAADIARNAAEESAKDAGALPLLSYLLDDMWAQMVSRGDGVLRLPASAIDLGRVLVERADGFLASRPGSADDLRRIFTLKLASVREDGEPTRRRALRSEFSEPEWQLVSELADHPHRLLVIATPEGGQAYAEVAHEAIFKRWDRLHDWMTAERGFLAWRTGLETARRAWQATPEESRDDALLMRLALAQARGWLAERAQDLPSADREFIELSVRRERQESLRARRIQSLIYVLLVGIILGLVAWMNQAYLRDGWRWYTAIRPYLEANFRPYVISSEAEHALKPLAQFRECAKDCPEMTVVPAGSFLMGSPAAEEGREDDEGPQHEVVLDKAFGVSRFDVTFDDWDACAAHGDCDPQISDGGFGRGRQPVINVTWDDAQRYVAWLSRMTGKPYRLLTEAEWEYAARSGTTTAYSFGDDPAMLDQYAWYSWNSGGRPHPVGERKPNAFGLYDMHGNVFQWVEDCYHDSYKGAPKDGSAWIAEGRCHRRVVRGGSWGLDPELLRSARRDGNYPGYRNNVLGFRVARALGP